MQKTFTASKNIVYSNGLVNYVAVYGKFSLQYLLSYSDFGHVFLFQCALTKWIICII